MNFYSHLPKPKDIKILVQTIFFICNFRDNFDWVRGFYGPFLFVCFGFGLFRFSFCFSFSLTGVVSCARPGILIAWPGSSDELCYNELSDLDNGRFYIHV